MRLIISLVKNAYVDILDRKERRQIGKGILVYLCISKEDELLSQKDLDKKIDKAVQRLSKLQIIEKDGKISTSVEREDLEILLISNFTVCGENKKGNKFSFDKAGSFNFSKVVFEKIKDKLIENNIKVKTGEFGEKMEVYSINLGPLNYILEI